MGTPPEHAGPRSQRRCGARGPSTPGGRPVSQAGSGRRRAVSHGKACAPWAVPGAPGRAASRKAPPRWGLGGPLLLRGRLRGCAGPGRASGGAPRPCPGEGSGGRPAPLPPPRGLSSHFVPRGKPGSAPRPAAWFRFPSPARRRDSVQTPGRRRAGPEASGRGGGGGLGSARPRPPPPAPQPPRLCGARGVRWRGTPVAAGLIPCHPRVGRDLAPASSGGAGAGGSPSWRSGPGLRGGGAGARVGVAQEEGGGRNPFPPLRGRGAGTSAVGSGPGDALSWSC